MENPELKKLTENFLTCEKEVENIRKQMKQLQLDFKSVLERKNELYAQIVSSISGNFVGVEKKMPVAQVKAKRKPKEKVSKKSDTPISP